MNALNAVRLYWIWASSLIYALLSLLSSDLDNVKNVINIMDSLAFYTGALSWALYFARLSINCFLVLKDSLQGPCLLENDINSTSWLMVYYDRFISELDKRKFELLNDLLWAPCNLLCYFWLNGSGTMGDLGSLLTIVLLLFDLSASLCSYGEKLSLYDKELKSFDDNLNLSADKKYLLIRLKNAKEDCERNWKYNQYQHYLNIGYSLGLVFSFALMTLPFVPLTVPLWFTTSFIGTGLCFGLTVLRDAIEKAIEMQREDGFINYMQLIPNFIVASITPLLILNSLLNLPLSSVIILLSSYATGFEFFKWVIENDMYAEKVIPSNHQLSFFAQPKTLIPTYLGPEQFNQGIKILDKDQDHGYS